MAKFFLFLCIFVIKTIFANAEIIKSISVNGNERITDETVVIFSKVNTGDDLIFDDLNNIIKNLYDTDFFKDVLVNNFMLL